MEGMEGRYSPERYSQESTASNISYQSLNEETRSLASNNYSGMNLDSPAGSQPQSNTASLPIQFPNSQGSVDDSQGNFQLN